MSSKKLKDSFHFENVFFGVAFEGSAVWRKARSSSERSGALCRAAAFSSSKSPPTAKRRSKSPP